MILDEYNSSFISYDLEPGIYTFKDFSEPVFNILQPEYPGFNNSIDIELDDFTMKTKLVVRPATMAIRFDESSFFTTIVEITPHWDYKHYNKYVSRKFINLSTTKKYT